MLRDMKPDERLAWAVGKLQELYFMPGFPESEEGIKTIAKAFLQIVGDQPANDKDEQYDVQLGKGVRVVYPEIPGEETADWLITEIVNHFDRFPMPIQMRALYEVPYLPADRKFTSTMGTSGVIGSQGG